MHTKAAEQFKHVPLHPLWHKHFSAPRHAMHNIGNRWNICGTNQKALDAIDTSTDARYLGSNPGVLRAGGKTIEDNVSLYCALGITKEEYKNRLRSDKLEIIGYNRPLRSNLAQHPVKKKEGRSPP